MNGQLRMLLWSEWRQRRVNFLFCLLWLVGGTCYGIAYELTHPFRTPVASFYSAASLFALFAPIFLAMRTSLGEITDRTKSFSDGVPVSTIRRAWIRLAGGAAVLIVPIVVGAVLLSACLAFGWIQQVPVRMPDWVSASERANALTRPSLSAFSATVLVWRVTMIVACSGCFLYIVVSLVGTMLRTEARAGLFGAVVAAIFFLATALGPMVEDGHHPELTGWIGAIAPQSLIIDYGYEVETGSYGDLSIPVSVLGSLIGNIVLQCGVAALFVIRYSGKFVRPAAARRNRARRSRLRPWFPLPTGTLALSWLALRQAVPMCLPGLLLACIMAPFQLDAANFDSNVSGARKIIDVLPSSMWIVGLLWAVVVGCGVFASETDWRIGEFWRTWPVSTWRLFSIKFLVGLTAVLVVLDGTAIVATWNSPNWGNYNSMNWPYIACIVPLHATMFAVAVAWACVLRRAVLGGMATIVTFAIVMAALEWSSTTRRFSPIEVYNRLNNRGPIETHGQLDFSAHGYPVVATVMGLAILVSLVIGWRALRWYRPRLAG